MVTCVLLLCCYVYLCGVAMIGYLWLLLLLWLLMLLCLLVWCWLLVVVAMVTYTLYVRRPNFDVAENGLNVLLSISRSGDSDLSDLAGDFYALTPRRDFPLGLPQMM